MSRQAPPSYYGRRSGPPGRDSNTGRSEYRNDQKASISKALSNQHRPLTVNLKSLGIRSDSVLYHIAERIQEKINKLDVWSTNFGRRLGGRYTGRGGDDRSYPHHRATGSRGGSNCQQGGRRSQDCTSLRNRQRESLRLGHEAQVPGSSSEARLGRHPCSRLRVPAVKSYVNDSDSRDTSDDSEAARFRRKMGIDTPPHTLPHQPKGQLNIVQVVVLPRSMGLCEIASGLRRPKPCHHLSVPARPSVNTPGTAPQRVESDLRLQVMEGSRD
jgi:hypothetical protein